MAARKKKEGTPIIPSEESPAERMPGVGFDFGTSFLVASEQDPEGITSKSLRDCYLPLVKADISKSLLSNFKDVLYLETEDRFILLAEKAWQISGSTGNQGNRNSFGVNKGALQTPLVRGFINPDDQDAYDILLKMVESMIGKPVVPKELLYYSVPAAPIDDSDMDEVYHRELLRSIFSELGYNAKHMNEAQAITFSECQEEGFSGLCISWGHGMTNFALTLDTIAALTFSVAQGGSYVDQMASKSTKKNPVLLQSIKESPQFNLMAPKGREQMALKIYYMDLISHALEALKYQFEEVANDLFIPQAVPLVVSGGTSMPKGFLEIFKQKLDEIEDFPIPISEVRAAKEPLRAVSRGLLIKARSESE